MNVKLQAMLNAGKWIEATYGRVELDRVLAAVTPAVRERYASGIAINWHPYGELVAFLDATERLLGSGDGRLAERIGAANARIVLSGSLARAAFYLARPSFLMPRFAGLWSRYNDKGTMEVLEFTGRFMRIEAIGVPVPTWLFCSTITGWAGAIGEKFYAEHPLVKHVQCRAKGDARCIWEARWLGEALGPADGRGDGPRSRS